MKSINYEKSLGSFIIKYLDDNEIVEGTINVDENSLKTDLCKYIIDNEEGTIFNYNNGSSKEQILLLKKTVQLTYYHQYTIHKYQYQIFYLAFHPLVFLQLLLPFHLLT